MKSISNKILILNIIFDVFVLKISHCIFQFYFFWESSMKEFVGVSIDSPFTAIITIIIYMVMTFQHLFSFDIRSSCF